MRANRVSSAALVQALHEPSKAELCAAKIDLSLGTEPLVPGSFPSEKEAKEK